jgi:uncharacterized protein YggU (UPF0235/DUF167 family)
MANPLRMTATPTGVRIEIRVMPRAPRTAIDGVRDGRVVVRVTAPPVDNAANDAVVAALAAALDLPRRAIRIASGAGRRNKTAEITGLDEAQVRARLPQAGC